MTDLQTPTHENVIGTRVAAVVDELSTSAGIEFKSAHETINRLEQLVLQSAAKAKAILENHISLVNQTKDEVGALRATVEGLAADHARLISTETN